MHSYFAGAFEEQFNKYYDINIVRVLVITDDLHGMQSAYSRQDTKMCS